MTILGVDPGSQVTGWAVVIDGAVHEYGRIRPKKGDRSGVSGELRRLVFDHSCDLVAVEEGYVGKWPKSAVTLGEWRGIPKLVADEMGVRWMGVTPAEAKIALTGAGNADKSIMVRMAEGQFGLEGLTEDEADAIGIALAAESRAEFEQACKEGVEHGN
jgi:crossover junction endodeoxyribonuclease RuvC